MFERSISESDHFSGAGEELERSRFAALWGRCLAGETSVAGEDVYARLAELYGEPHRHYHTLVHIRRCLREFDRAAELMDVPGAVEMALWFHDAIYVPGATDNEWQSAELFRRWSGERADPAFLQRVYGLIMTTTHRGLPGQRDEGFIMDIDLSSFGMPWEAFERDGRRIRAEFADLTDDRYYPDHLRFLLALQNRPTIYFTDFFQQHYEQVARDNIRRIVADLRARGFGRA